MDDIFALGSAHPGVKPTWASIDVQGRVRQQPIGAAALKGLTYNPTTRRYYTIAPSGPAGPRVCSLSVTGALQTAGSVGPNLTGGIAYRPSDDRFYAISNDSDGLARLHRITTTGQDITLFPVSDGVCSGLAHVRTTDTFYALITKQNLTSIYSIKLSGTVTKLFGVGTRVFGGLGHSPAEGLFYLVANDAGNFSHLWTVALNGTVQRRMGLGYSFNHAGISIAPWHRGSMYIKSPLEGERFVHGEATTLDADILTVTGASWDSEGVAWESSLDGQLGTGSPTVTLSKGTHVITATKQRLRKSINIRVFADLGALYQAPPAQAEIDRVLREFDIQWVDGAPGDPTQQWASFPGYPFDQASPEPSRTAVICKLDVLRHQRFSQPLPFGTAPTAYEQVRRHTKTVRASLGSNVNMAGAGVINLNRSFALWSANPAAPTVPTAYIHSLYLFLHESRHNEPDDPAHTSCTAWTGAPGTPSGMDAQFDPGSGYARAALYLFWVHKFSLYDPAPIRDEAKATVMGAAHKDRFCAHPTSANPTVQTLLTELWGA